MRRNRRVTFSQRTTFAHWLIRIGRSRHDCTHLAYMVPMIVSEVGRTTRRSSSTSLPPCVTQATCGAKPSHVLGLLHQQAFRDEQRKVGVDVAGGLEPAIEPLLHQLPDRVAVRADDHAALHGRIVGQLGAADDVDVPAPEVLGLRGDFGREVGEIGLSSHGGVSIHDSQGTSRRQSEAEGGIRTESTFWDVAVLTESATPSRASAMRFCQCRSSRRGKSARKWPPRLSWRRSAACVTSRPTVTRLPTRCSSGS